MKKKLIKAFFCVFLILNFPQISWGAFGQGQLLHHRGMASPAAQLTLSYANNSVNLSWVNGGANSAEYLVVRGADNTPPVFSPVQGTTYSVGSVGADSIVYVGSNTSTVDSYSPSRDYTAYYYIYAFDSNKNYTAHTAGSVSLARPLLDSITNQSIARFQTMTPINAADLGDDLDNKNGTITYSCHFDQVIDGAITESSQSLCNSTNLPGSVAFNTTTGELSGYTPDKFISREFKIKGCDSLNNCHNRFFSLNVSTTCAGVIYSGYCMYCGGASQSCTTVCSTHNGWDAVATRDLYGSGGTNSDCTTATNQICSLSYSFDSTSLSSAGCYVDASSKKSTVIKRGTIATTSEASGTDLYRLCGCNS